MFACLHVPGFPRDAPADCQRDLLAVMVALAESFGPDYEIDRPDTAVVDLSGCRPPLVWNPPLPRLRLAMAGTPDLAVLAALADAPFSGKPMAVGDFDPLPIDILTKSGFAGWADLLPVFELWGLRTLGEIRRLPRQGLAERAGPAALRLHDVLHGRVRRLLKLHRAAECFIYQIDFEHPVDSLEALVFQANRAFQTLCARLQSHHLAAGKIRFRLSFESMAPVGRSIALPEPLCTAEALLRPLHAAFESLRVPDGITALELELEPVRAPAAQREFLGRQLRQPERWADTLARLEGLLGPGRLGIPQPEFTHRPDAFRVVALTGKVADLTTGESPRPDAGCPLPLRRFRPPLEVAVASTNEGARPRPQALLTGPHAGRITGLRGPFPISGDWWDPASAWQRLEWDIGLESGHLLRLVHLPPDRWLLDGAYE